MVVGNTLQEAAILDFTLYPIFDIIIIFPFKAASVHTFQSKNKVSGKIIEICLVSDIEYNIQQEAAILGFALSPIFDI